MKKLAISFVCAILLNAFGLIESNSTERPNILYIIADDMGFTDLGAFGSEIPTPNLDELAHAGLRLTNLHAASYCRPTRLMLMTGAPAHVTETSYPGAYRNAVMSLEYATMAELLQDAGYATFTTGKWDLGEVPGHTPEVRGFDRSFVEIRGSNSYFGLPFRGVFGLRENGRQLSPEDLPDDYYATGAYTDKLLEYLRSHPSDQPWFAYLSYTAPHWPLQLPEDWIDRYADKYNDGYDVLREKRFASALRAGVIPKGGTLEQYTPVAEPWDELSPYKKQRYARGQEIYAGMVEYMDMSIGRIISYLKESGQLDNTLVVFTSDHGASGAEYGIESDRTLPLSGPTPPTKNDNRLENYGRAGSWIDHGRGFGEAATAPFKYMKNSMAEGGLRTAAFVYFPQQVASGEVSNSFVTIMDLLPTFLEVAGTEHPGIGAYRDGRQIKPIAGRSAWSHFTGQSPQVHSASDSFGLSVGKTGILIRGDYKIMNIPQPGTGGTTPWQLYNIIKDPGEHDNLADQFPDLVNELVAEWETNWR